MTTVVPTLAIMGPGGLMVNFPNTMALTANRITKQTFETINKSLLF